MSGGGMGRIELCKASVLYLGSAVPLETAVGIEAIQTPCRERYLNALDSNMKIAGIDAGLTVYSSGLLLEYSGDRSTTWFPIQTMHVSSAVKCAGSSFIALDSPDAENSPHPPIFACIMRRTTGIKVLECHVFLCKSSQDAMNLVQACAHAYEHREGWMCDDSFGGAGRPVPMISGNQGGGGGGFNHHHIVQNYSISNYCQQPQQPPPQQPVPAPPLPPQQTVQYVPMQMQNQYFTDWDSGHGQTMMIAPDSPFYQQGQCCSGRKKCSHKKKHKKCKKKHKKESHSSDEEEIYYLRRKGGDTVEEVVQQCPQPAPEPKITVNEYVLHDPKSRGNDHIRDYQYYRGGGGHTTEYFTDAYNYAAQQAAAQYEVDRRAAEDYVAALEYNRAIAQAPHMLAAEGYHDGGGFWSNPNAQHEIDQRAFPEIWKDPQDVPGGPDPWGYYTGPLQSRGYSELVDGLGYYP